MIPSRATRRWIGTKTRQYAYAIGAAVLFAAVTIKTFWFTPPELVTALAGDYGALTVGTAAFIAAALGIERFFHGDAPGPMQTKGHSDDRPEA